jgi:DHA3 family macrolide efflux protein-like MFS transporter
MNDSIAVSRSVTPPLRPYLVIWAGQVISTFGSSLTSFALGVWVFERTGLATQFALMGFFSSLPALLFAPFAGALVDRWDRRWAMILSDGGAALVTAVLIGLFLGGNLQFGHLYVAMAVSSLFGSFQWPAYSAMTTLLVPRDLLGRVNGLDQFGQAASQLLAPMLAAFLLMAVGLPGVMTLDLATFLLAVASLLWVRVPRPPRAALLDDAMVSDPPFLDQVRMGWQFLAARPGLRDLLLYFAVINLLAGFNMALLTPLVLSVASPAGLGIVLSISSAGLVAGGLAMSLHGGPARRMRGVLGFGLLYGLSFLFIGLNATLPAIAASSFLLMFSVPLINGCSQVIWQTKVPPDLQGRVFAIRRMIAQATVPLAFLLAGPLADRIFRPLLLEGGALAGSLGRVLGVGAGRGIGLLYVLLGICALCIGAAAYLSRRLQGLEAELPDWVEV